VDWYTLTVQYIIHMRIVAADVVWLTCKTKQWLYIAVVIQMTEENEIFIGKNDNKKNLIYLFKPHTIRIEH